jgi:hypothetical protein
MTQSQLDSGIVPENAAIARCCAARQNRFDTGKAKGEEKVISLHYADQAYCDAMPALVDYESIRDFIACTAYGMLSHIILSQHGTQLLYAAQIALSTFRHRPQPKDPKPEKQKPIAA